MKPVTGIADGLGTGPTSSSIARMLRPRSIALLGVSSKAGSLAEIVLDNLERFAYRGEVYLIHRTLRELRGRPCLESVAALPFGVDCVVLAIPVAGIPEAIDACAARGVGSVIIFSGGFAELGAAGREQQERIAATARAHGIAVEGPNCLGYVNYIDGVPLTFSIVEPRPVTGASVAIISQSGAMAAALRAALHGRQLDIALAVSTGNEAVSGLEEFVEHALTMTQVRVLAVMAEHIRDPQRFLRLAREARAKGIVIVLLHPGRSMAARRSAVTHTGAMVGDHALIKTMLEHAAVLFVETLEKLVDLTDCALRCRKFPRGGVAMLSESGAYKAIALDYREIVNLSLPPPEGAAEAALNELAPGLIVASNPLDLTAQALGDPTLYDQAIGHLLANPACGSLLVTVILSSPLMAARKMPPVIAAMKKWAQTHAVFFAMLGEDSPVPDDIVATVREAGVPFFRSPERAMRALAQFSRWGGKEVPSLLAVPHAPRLPPGVIPEYRAKDLFEQAGLPVGPRRLATTLDAAIDTARAIGYPVVLKVQSATLGHKSDVGGVILNLQDDESLKRAWHTLQANVGAKAPEAQIEGVLVERMARGAMELIVGGRNDPAWGAAIVVGFGGVNAEVIDDVRLMPADLDADAVMAELAQLRGARLFEAFRGAGPRDMRALCDALVKLGRFLLAHPEVTEFDINPLLLYAEGEGCLILDALISCA
jgi:acyl-CoA synthetase (NDP forming)